MEFLTFLFVLIISIVGISFAGYKEWLNFQAKQHKFGLPSEVEEKLHSLQDRLAEVERKRNALRSRVQNLETIVTSEAWAPCKMPPPMQMQGIRAPPGR